ncbi:autotransporter outer membrane beta-barrel domain-containing protein [Mesorhizobium qingshengii]|uniref:Outer membrane autotransporter barrel domain-containing protein n=1 Tax=Mesorhizobium qingshengii TaxID=1165689 RepID=A0A1G5Z8Y2_9HYPH|nr:autotransporter domain-containing protein [Mesorhizobium qingshengii]SDA91499.1 outer membrane autotransporter barrel domain-containing protein [Mesorhizobium qingshengii]
MKLFARWKTNLDKHAVCAGYFFRSSASVIAIAASVWASQSQAETITISTATTVPVSSVVESTGTVNVTQTGSVTTQSGGNHAIQPYLSPGLGVWTVNVDGLVKVLDVDNDVYGIWLRAGGTVNVSSTGKVEGSRKGLVIEGGVADVQNDGLISGSQIAVHVLAGGNVENRGTLLGGVVFATSPTPGTFVNKGNVSSNGGGFGVIMNGGGSLNNSGTIEFTNIGQGLWSRGDFTFTNTGTYTAKGDASFSSPIYGVLLQNGNVAADNSGTIEGRDVGLFVSQGTADVTNSGTITATKVHAVALQTTGAASFTQTAGALNGGTHGLSVVTSGDTEVTITGGVVTGGLSSANGIGVRFGGSGKTQMSVANATITGAQAAIQGGTGSFDLSLLQGSIINGDVKLGSGNSSLKLETGASVQGNIDAEAGTNTLLLTGSGSGSFQGNFLNFASAKVDAAGGKWALGSDVTLVDGMELVAGSLAVNGSLNGTVAVRTGAGLGGTGTVGAMTIDAGGVHAPGNSIGTQAIAGNYVNHGTLQIEATPAAADQVKVSGTVDISGATLDLLMSPNSASSWNISNGPFNIIDNDDTDAVTGVFGAVNKNLLFLDEKLDYAGGDGNDVTLELIRNDIEFAEVGITPNQRAVAGAIDSLNSGNPLWNAIALQGDSEATRTAFDQLTGEIHASAKTALINDTRLVLNAINERLRAAFSGTGATASLPVMAFGEGGPELAPATTDQFAAWSTAFGSWGHAEEDGNASLKRSTGGVVFGVDGPAFETWRLGAIAGYSHTNIDVEDRASSGDSANYNFGLYGGAQWNQFGLRTGAAYVWHNIETGRTVTFPGFADSLQAKYGAGTFHVFGEAGYRIDAVPAAFEPFANLSYVSLHTDAYSESGGASALHAESQTTEATSTTFGLRASTSFDLSGIRVTTNGTIGWRHAYGDTIPLSTFTFGGSEAFDIVGVPIARDVAVVEAAIDLNLTDDAIFGVTYSGQLASGSQDHTFNARVGVEF